MTDAAPEAIERRAIVNREEWLAWRMADVTASDLSALFGRHPYGRSALSIWAEKAGLTEGLADNPVLRRGRWGEAAAIEMLQDVRPTWTVRRLKIYVRDRTIRLGATPDAEAIDPERPGRGVVQTKVIARHVFERDWSGEPPFGFQLQTLVEMMLWSAVWGAIAALVVDGGAWFPAIFDIKRHEGAEARIRAAVVRFWADFDAGLMPIVNPQLDAEPVTSIYPKALIKAPPLDLSNHKDLPVALNQWARLKDTIAAAVKRVEPIETQIKARLGPHESATLPGWRISWRNEPRKAYAVAASNPRILRITTTKEGTRNGDAA
jgi:predicted phage-related endonuclease